MNVIAPSTRSREVNGTVMNEAKPSFLDRGEMLLVVGGPLEHVVGDRLRDLRLAAPDHRRRADVGVR